MSNANAAPVAARATKALFYAAALATFGMVYSIARAHHPLGFLYGLFA